MTPAGALSVCPANAADTPGASAPSSGSSSDSRVFGQQLRDARDSISSSTDDGAPQSGLREKRAAAREAEKKSQGDGEAQVTVPIPITAQRVPALPFSLDFGLMDGIAAGKDIQKSPASAAEPTTSVAETADDTKADDTKKDTGLAATPDPLMEGQQTVAMPKELTFALKLDAQPNGKSEQKIDEQNMKDASRTAQAELARRIPAAVKSSAGAVKAIEESHAAQLQADAAAPRNDGMARMAAFQIAPPSPAATGPQAPAHPPIEPAKALETSAIQATPPDSSSKIAGPLKELSIQVGQTPQDRVQVRLVDRGGEVQVAVRSANPDVAQGLRQGLSDLVGRLEQNGYRTEAWRPGGSVSSIQGTGESRQKEMQFQRDGSQSQSGGSQQGRQQNPQNQGYRPRWVRELEGSLSDGGNSTQGDSNGITN